MKLLKGQLFINKENQYLHIQNFWVLKNDIVFVIYKNLSTGSTIKVTGNAFQEMISDVLIKYAGAMDIKHELNKVDAGTGIFLDMASINSLQAYFNNPKLSDKRVTIDGLGANILVVQSGLSLLELAKKRVNVPEGMHFFNLAKKIKDLSIKFTYDTPVRKRGKSEDSSRLMLHFGE